MNRINRWISLALICCLAALPAAGLSGEAGETEILLPEAEIPVEAVEETAVETEPAAEQAAPAAQVPEEAGQSSPEAAGQEETVLRETEPEETKQNAPAGESAPAEAGQSSGEAAGASGAAGAETQAEGESGQAAQRNEASAPDGEDGAEQDAGEARQSGAQDPADAVAIEEVLIEEEAPVENEIPAQEAVAAAEAPAEEETPVDTPVEEVIAEPEPVADAPEDVFDDYELDENGNLTVYEGVAAIPAGAFEGHPGIVNVFLPDSVLEIGEKAFAGCERLEELHLPETITILGKAFANCTALQRIYIGEDVQLQLLEEDVEPAAQLPGGVTIARDAFEGVLPAKESGQDSGDSSEDPEDPEDPEPSDDRRGYEASYDAFPMGGSSGSAARTGGTSQKTTTTTTTRRRHARATAAMTHDYDEVQLTGVPETPVSTLILGGEKLDLTLEGGTFTMAMYDPEHPQAARAQQEAMGDTLILSSGEDGAWKLNGAVLRKLNRSGVETLVLKNGDATTSVPTEGFLAGWAYDELKSRGTAGRRFDYEMSVDETGTHWRVTVEGKTYELGEDPLSPMYLTGVISGKGE